MIQFENVITLVPGEVSLDQLRRILHGLTPVEIDACAFAAVERSHAVVDDVIARGAVVYGINTGFGKMAQTVIPSDKLAELQKNLVLSHSVGTGELLADSTVRLIMVLKAISLSRGHSGVRPQAIHALVQLINAGVYPCIPAKGSVGASGDLAPLAHMTAVLIGVGHARVDGKRVTALEGLRHAGLEPLQLGPKEGLAFLNGTQVSTALALVGLFAAEDVFASAVLAGALSLEAIKGSLAPFDNRIHAARGQRGQIDVAAAYRALLEDSPIVSSHHDCGRVQDPYSIRCQPQVMGACLDQLRHAAEVLRIEANAASDNPLVFADEGDVLSGGNFHAEPVAIAADNIAIAIAEIGAISERRLALLLEFGDLLGLAAVPGERRRASLGVHDRAGHGFAALASENKSLAHPASVDQSPDLRQSGKITCRWRRVRRARRPRRHGREHRRSRRHRSDGSRARGRVSSPPAFDHDARSGDRRDSRERGLL